MKPPIIDTIHSDILERFVTLIKNGRLAHAYFFTGPQGIGKVSTALALAKLVNCEDMGARECHCPSCLKIDNGNHADVVVIEHEEDKTVISADQIRALIGRLELKSLEGKYKVVILKDADELSPEAANIFLKTLEEPSSDTLLILTSAAPGRFLRTITSRCHEVRFFPLSNDSLATRLRNEYDISSVDADILAKFAAGSPGKAAEIQTSLMEEKNVILNEFVFAPANEAILKKYASDKDLARELCGVLLTFFRDVWLWKSGVGEEALFNRDRLVDVRRLASKYDLSDIEHIVDQVVMARRAADENFNVKIALTVLKEMI
ncbi:MAG: DNA polymerase III subunit delta' [Candidatus Omnitrophica bacterium]|nr:DNA polymerase III subunit delta' [Candidatus Omnitrophota bacterium]